MRKLTLLIIAVLCLALSVSIVAFAADEPAIEIYESVHRGEFNLKADGTTVSGAIIYGATSNLPSGATVGVRVVKDGTETKYFNYSKTLVEGKFAIGISTEESDLENGTYVATAYYVVEGSDPVYSAKSLTFTPNYVSNGDVELSLANANASWKELQNATTVVKVDGISATLANGDSIADYLNTLDSYDNGAHTVSVECLTQNGDVYTGNGSINVVKDVAGLKSLDNLAEGTKYYVTKDISVTSTDYATKSYVGRDWTAKGDGIAIVNEIYGEIDGLGHKITFNYDAATAGHTGGSKFAGFIGYIGNNAIVRNLHLDMTANVCQSETGLFFACHGLIEDCYIKSRMTSGLSDMAIIYHSTLYSKQNDNDYRTDMTRCIVDSIAYDGSGSPVSGYKGCLIACGGYANNTTWSGKAGLDLTDVILISSEGQTYFTYVSGGTRTRCYRYVLADELLKENGNCWIGKTSSAAENVTFGDADKTTVTLWDNTAWTTGAWDISLDGIKFFGNTVVAPTAA